MESLAVTELRGWPQCQAERDCFNGHTHALGAGRMWHHTPDLPLESEAGSRQPTGCCAPGMSTE